MKIGQKIVVVEGHKTGEVGEVIASYKSCFGNDWLVRFGFGEMVCQEKNIKPVFENSGARKWHDSRGQAK